MQFDSYYGFREELVRALHADLVGPSEEHEIIDDTPLEKYSMGILYPSRKLIDKDSKSESQSELSEDNDELRAELDVDLPEDDGDGDLVPSDPPVAMANRKNPSSMGMTFAVDTSETDTISLNIQAARYTLITEDPSTQTRRAEPEPGSGNQSLLFRAGSTDRWQRQPIYNLPILIPLNVAEPGKRSVLDTENLELFYRVRRYKDSPIASVTVVLLNNNYYSGDDIERNSSSFFQPTIEAVGPEHANVFAERPMQAVFGNDEDIRSYRLLYRRSKEFAIGHGCSVEWDLPDNIFDRAKKIRTVFDPRYELPLADSNPDIKLKCLGMKFLAEDSKTEILKDLENLCSGYESWIVRCQEDLDNLSSDLKAVGESHLAACREALKRIRKGITVLEEDALALKAFKYANAAMLQQRARTEWLRSGKRGSEPVESPHLEWRPFQLAFILLCLSGITDPKKYPDDRNTADLLWFPTGGGKTEAYLGLIAYTVFLRRLKKGFLGGGVTAIMRYTLRLLTLQQFERASLLIASCEKLRRENKELGTDPVSIGLWVGQGATPNTLDDARAALNKIKDGVQPDTGNPIQLHTCPWCGEALGPKNYVPDTRKHRLVIGCGKKDCYFKDELPVFVIDDDVYNFRPTLIIATVDKFASLPWRESAAELFNLKTSQRSAQARPELIIQDELHLISGPLGTLTGLYETAVDMVCTEGNVRPKVIASTATIRRAGDQTRGLFNREMRQFPPPGLEAGDSYFAVEAPREKKGTRLYVGLLAPSKSHTTLLIRTYAVLLQKAKDLIAEPSVKDPYYTLVGYFNSLRVLGGAKLQIQDDVDARIDLLVKQTGNVKREIENVIELTSRESSSAIPEHLKNMAVSLPDPNVLDVILATNMISVGVDIDRLGLMAVMGQPQATSEYIQSTSRVGRKFPGLVVTLYNSSKSRDRSHYESFLTYHSALYRQVEAAGVTPFSPRSRDRGLHAVLVAIARLLLPDFRPNSGAKAVLTHRDDLERIRDQICERIQEVTPEEADFAYHRLNDIINTWQKKAEETYEFSYQNLKEPEKALLTAATGDPYEPDEAYATLWSLRDVDKESKLVQI